MLLKTNGSESVNSRRCISAFIKKYSYVVLQLLKCPLRYSTISELYTFGALVNHVAEFSTLCMPFWKLKETCRNVHKRISLEMSRNMLLSVAEKCFHMEIGCHLQMYRCLRLGPFQGISQIDLNVMYVTLSGKYGSPKGASTPHPHWNHHIFAPQFVSIIFPQT